MHPGMLRWRWIIVPVFTRRARRQLTTHPKLFSSDVGVFRSLRPSGPLDRPQEIAGAALEGLVAQHLRSLLSFHEDYPEAELRLVYRGARTLEIVGIRCVPCERFLRVCGPEAGCREGRWRPGAWPATAPGALLLAGRAPAPTLR